MMDCKTVLQWIERVRPSGDELATSELAPVAGHLQRCPDCLEKFRVHQRVDEVIARGMCAVPIPSGLRERILSRLDRQRVSALPGWMAALRQGAAVLTLLAATVLLVLTRHWVVDRPVVPAVEIAVDKLGELAEGAELVDLRTAPAADDLAPWLSRELRRLKVTGEPPRAHPLAGLVGVARARIADCWVAVFRYNDPRSPGPTNTDVFACSLDRFRVTSLDDAPQRIYKTRDRIVLAWVEGGIVYVAVFDGWLPPGWDGMRPGRQQPLI
jgi:hypothetical protein